MIEAIRNSELGYYSSYNIDMASEVTSKSGKRIFPPLHVQTGDISRDRLAFIHILERLKVKADIFI